ncbi:Xanthine dehydrogenase/oxidase, partial [Lamellibrachia satsuma]
MALVTSKEAHANIISVVPSRALQMAGVVDYINAEDLFSEVEQTDEIFATKQVLCRGQTIGAIVARSQTEALEAADAVDIVYEPLPAIISIQQAIDAGSFFSEAERTLTNGDLTAGFGASDVIIESEVYVGGQEHFYMETQSCVAVPRGEDGEMEIFSSTQFPTGVQTGVANVLGVSSNKIVCHVKRVGGAFGGKVAACMLVALPAAVAANKLHRPVRCVLERSTDMDISGQRRPVLAKYKVGCTKDRRILALDISVFANCGSVVSYSPNVSFIADMAMIFLKVFATLKVFMNSSVNFQFLEVLILYMDNGYKIPNFRVRGHACRTNLPTFQSCRGFGSPQGMFILQTVLQHIAETLKLPPDQVSELNLYKEADLTPYNQMLEDCHVRQCWQDVMQRGSYKTRCAQVNQFNREHRWKKRGLAIVPIKFPITIAATVSFFNQYQLYKGTTCIRRPPVVNDHCQLLPTYQLYKGTTCIRRPPVVNDHCQLLPTYQLYKGTTCIRRPPVVNDHCQLLLTYQLYKDGTVLVAHGGCELGQGLHTKMVQVTSRGLGIPIEKIHISETSTNTVPNAAPSGASVSSDLNGMAIANACQVIMERLEPFKTAAPEDGWEKWAVASVVRSSTFPWNALRLPCVGTVG